MQINALTNCIVSFCTVKPRFYRLISYGTLCNGTPCIFLFQNQWRGCGRRFPGIAQVHPLSCPQAEPVSSGVSGGGRWWDGNSGQSPVHSDLIGRSSSTRYAW
uniref:Uncharacterized protein n=1 Tax=Cacopsylla melanoneura TaxID=428564 RepID=A0A8D9AFT7_9HEMI